jgi:uncharacterized Ntn-hydrolase superfamily protein
MSNQNPNNRQINAIIGAAIRAFVETGADDESIGAFATDYRAKVARYLGEPETSLKTPDLAEVVTQAVAAALAQAGEAKKRQTPGVQTRRFNIEFAGRRTSLSIRNDVASRLAQEKGSLPEARKFIQEVAKAAPKGIENRSAWVEERIEAYLAYSRREDGAGREPASRH